MIVAHAPDLLFFKDINGDDVADHKEVLLTGFGIYDTHAGPCLLYTSPSPRDRTRSRMPSSA